MPRSATPRIAHIPSKPKPCLPPSSDLFILLPLNLASAFAASAQKNETKTALYWGQRAFSYREIRDLAGFVAEHLRSRFNAQPGDRVGLWLKNCPEFVPALLGVLQCGAVAVPINNFLKPDEVNFILGDAGIDVLIVSGELNGHFQALKATRPALKLLNGEKVLASFPIAPGNVKI